MPRIEAQERRTGRATRRRKARLTWRRVHLGLALVAGFLFAFLGITGSLLVFHREVDALLNADLMVRRSKGGEVAIPAVVATVAESTGPALRVDAPRGDLGVYRVQARDWSMAGALMEVFVDPGTGQVLGKRAWRSDPVSVLYDLHYTLLLGRRGQDIVGFAGLALLVSIGSGLYLWWPPRRRFWRALQVKRGASGSRRVYDIHKAAALPAAALLTISAISGATMTFPDAARRITQAVLPAADSAAADAAAMAGLPGDPGLARAIARATEIVPGSRVRRVLLPAGARADYHIHLRRPGDLLKSGGLNRVAVSATTGQVVRARDSRDFRPADWFLALQFPLHNGEAFGLAGRFVVFVLGLVPATLYVTGLLLWRNRRQARTCRQDGRRRRNLPYSASDKRSHL